MKSYYKAGAVFGLIIGVIFTISLLFSLEEQLLLGLNPVIFLILIEPSFVRYIFAIVYLISKWTIIGFLIGYIWGTLKEKRKFHSIIAIILLIILVSGIILILNAITSGLS